LFRKLDATLFYGLLLPRLSKTYTGAAAVLVDEFDAGRFQRLADNLQSRATWFVLSTLELTNCDNPHARLFGQFMLAPIKETPGRPALARRDHQSPVHWDNYVEKRLICPKCLL